MQKTGEVDKIVFVALGGGTGTEQIGNAEVKLIPFEADPLALARFYQASDVYIHAARADTFPNAVIEAMACGTPVVATSVGGIPEQIDDGRTGFLTPPGDADVMADRIVALLSDSSLLTEISANASKLAREKFDLARQVNDYLSWYRAILEH